MAIREVFARLVKTTVRSPISRPVIPRACLRLEALETRLVLSTSPVGSILLVSQPADPSGGALTGS
jgi:hypothetical protein